MKLSLTVQSALRTAGIDAAASPALASLVVRFAYQRSGIDARNYYSEWSDKDGRRAFRTEYASITRQLAKFRELLAVAASVGVEDRHVIEAGTRAFSGRLTWTGSRWDYTTGQYFCTEYRAAACAVLDTAIRARRQELPPTTREGITSIAELRELNERNGGCWFERGSMKFFGTRIESGIIRGRFFVTSEQPPHGARKYSVRKFDNKGRIDTVGEFCGYSSRREALAAARNA
jgi:hypothetical protein